MQTGAAGDQRAQLVNVDTAPSWVRQDASGDLTLGTAYQYSFRVYAYPSDGGDYVPSNGDDFFGYTEPLRKFWNECSAPQSPVTLSATAPNTLSIEFGIPASPYGKGSASGTWDGNIETFTVTTPIQMCLNQFKCTSLGEILNVAVRCKRSTCL